MATTPRKPTTEAPAASTAAPGRSATKELLLDQLHDVFTLHGFHGSTLAHLAKATGLSKASLYHHFPGGKSEIAATLVRRAIARCHGRAYRHLTEGPATGARVSRFLAGFLDYTHDGERSCLLAVLGQETLPDARLNTVLRQQFLNLQTLSQPIRPAQRSKRKLGC